MVRTAVVVAAGRRCSQGRGNGQEQVRPVGKEDGGLVKALEAVVRPLVSSTMGEIGKCC